VYLTAQEAAAELGVSVSTLYAYVGRKQIRSQRVKGSKSRLYWREDIARLKRTSSAIPADPFVPQTSITLITPEGPFYRGQSAIGLAQTETLESVCGLLWGPAADGVFETFSLRTPKLYQQVLEGLEDAPIFEKACSLLPILERANPRAHDLSPAGYCRSGADIMRWFASLIAGTAPSSQPLHECLAEGLRAPPGYADIIRRLLVLSADHELDPSTYAVRAVANTGVTAFQLVLVGLACASGRRLSFGRATTISQMMSEIVGGPDPKEPIYRRLREGEPVYGFSSRVYPDGDPRAAALLKWIREVNPDDPDLKRLDAAIEVAEETMDGHPDYVIPLTFVAFKLGVPNRGGALLRLARIAGWIAHATEQYHSQDLVRLRTVYAGALPGHGDDYQPARSSVADV
jgi:citrate synthase